MDLYKKIGDAVRKRRLKLGLSQQDLAGDADMERSYISAVENGRKSIRVETLVRLAMALNTKPGKFLDDSLSPKS